jgi:hypothetical protein
MKKSILPLLMSFFITSSALAKITIREQILEILPSDLSSIKSGDSRSDIESRLSSKISKKDKPDTLYLNYFDEKNDVSIGTEGGKFSYLYVELPQSLTEPKKDLFESIVSQLSTEQKKKMAQEQEKKISHDKGRYIIIDLPEEGLKLEFSNNEKKLLHSMIVFPKEKK